MRVVIAIGLMLVCSVLYADNSNQSFRDSRGRYQGSSTTTRDGRSTTYRDSLGRYLGSSTSTKSGTTFRDSRGSYKGSASGSVRVSPSYFKSGSSSSKSSFSRGKK